MLLDSGQFGLSAGRYEVSRARGERMLFPAVRGASADEPGRRPGFSCRRQSADFCDNRRSRFTTDQRTISRSDCEPARLATTSEPSAKRTERRRSS